MKFWKENKNKLILNIITWGSIGLLSVFIVSAQSIKRDSRLGRDAYEALKETNERIDSVCVRNQRQDVINAVVNEKINKISQDVGDIKRMVEMLYINELEGK